MFHVKLIKNRKLIDERIKELAEKCQTLMKEKVCNKLNKFSYIKVFSNLKLFCKVYVVL